MVAIVAGKGLGLRNTSLNTIGAEGGFGQSAIGQGSDRALINVVSGNLVLQSQDAQLAGRGADLFALRTYNSLGAPTDGDQDGWRWAFEQAVRFQGPGDPAHPAPGATVVRTDADGYEDIFTWNDARNAYVGANGSTRDELTYDAAAAQWTWTAGVTRETELYSNSNGPGMTGRLLRRTDTSNNSILLDYDADRLSLIKDTSSQQELRLKYGVFNGLTRLQHLEARALVDDQSGHPTSNLGDPVRLVDYDYDNQGRLTTVTRLLTPANGTSAGPAFITNYGYEDSSNRIATVNSSDGTGAVFAYDAAGRVSAVLDHGGAPRAQLALSYGPQPNSTAITDGDGQIWTYRHDAITGHLTEVLTPPVGGASLSTTFRYDANGNLVGVTDPHNDTTTYAYDDVGNRALERDAAGNTTTRTFSPLNQLLTETHYRISDRDGAGPQGPDDPITTRYVYDSNFRLRFVVSAEGRVTESRYGGPNAGHGLVTQTLLYVGHLFDVTGLSPTQQLTEQMLIDWVAGLPDKTQVQLTEYNYDLRGNVSQQISYATVSTNGAVNGASVTQYIYDARSLLRQRIAVRGDTGDQRTIVTTLDYDGLTRVRESSGADGRQTTVYDDANGRVIVTFASGLIETREYDSRRRLLKVAQTADGTTRETRYVYDDGDRLTMVDDSNGGRRYSFYDAAGRLEFKVDATGAVTRLAQNATGQLVRKTQYANRVDTASWYDNATNTVTKSDLTIGGAGSDVIADAAHDRVTTFDYDAAGRLTNSTDGEGTVTTVSYDGLSRVIMTQTGDRVTRYLYDKDDRRVGIVDALNYFTEYKYDAGGRLIETVRYSQPSAAAEPGSNDPAAWRPANTDDALHSFFFYDGQGRVVGSVDEQQFLSETVYNDTLNTKQTLRYPTPVTLAAGDNLASVRSRAGTAQQTSLFRYDDFGRLREVTALDGATITRNDYDEAGRLVRVLSAADTDEERVHHTFYNAFGEVTATLGGEGSAWLGANPSADRVDEAIRDYGIRYKYDSVGRLVQSVDANGNTTLMYYDRESRKTHQVHVIGRSSALAGEVSGTTYNSFGQAQSVRRYAARIAHDDMVQLMQEGGGLADQSLLTRLATLADDTTDQLSFFEYDRCGRQLKQSDNENTFTENIYNIHGELAAQVRSIRNGQTTRKQFDYDLKGRLVSQTDDAGGINANTRTEYDAFDRVIRSVDAMGQATSTSYEDNGRSIVVTDPLGHSTRTTYDAHSRVSSLINALGQQINYAYDEANRTVAMTSAEGHRVTTEKTRHGETLSVTDARGNVTRYEFNRDGQPTTVTDALGRAIVQTRYDKSGRKTDLGNGVAFVSFKYDQRNRVISRRFDANVLNLTTNFEFDALGNQISVTEWSPTSDERITKYTYDRKGRTKTIVRDAAEGGLKLCTTHSYDDLDNVVITAQGTESNPNQQVIVSEFDNLGRRVKEVAAPSSVFGTGAPGTRDLTTQYRYDASGRLTRRIDRNGNSTWYVYDSAGQQIRNISALGEVSESRYDVVGRLVFSRRYVNRLAADVVASFGDVAALVTPTASSDDQRSYVVYDADGRVRFNLRATGTSGWVISENRCDANGNDIELRVYDKFLPDARVETLDSSGISVEEIQQELSGTLGYHDDDPATLAGVQRKFFAYDATNRLHFAVDSLGSVIETVYDAVGNLLTTVRFAVRPTLAQYTEAEIEAAINRDDPNNSVKRNAYDRANQLRYTVDTLGFVTENEFDARGNVVRSVRRAVPPPLTTYTETAIAAVLSGIPVTQNDQVTRFVYDDCDRLRFTFDVTGSVTENRYDWLGNVVESTRFAQRPAPVTFTENDVAAAVAPLRNDVENQVNRFAYDVEKRLRFTVDTQGSVTESVFDANSNLLATTRFGVRPSLAAYDEGTIAAAVAPLQTDPANRTARFAYDALNRLRFSVDSLGSVSERIYNALGQVMSTVRFAVRPALAAYSESAIDAAVSPERAHASNRIEHHVYDALGRARFNVVRVSVVAGEPKYQVTAQDFDALGQVIVSNAYATPAALNAINESEIITAVGNGDLSRDRVSRFVYDLAGRQIYRLQALTVDGDRRKYRVSEQRFDTFGQVVSRTEYATAVAPAAFERGSIAAAVQAVADQSRDRSFAIVYDALGQAIYSLRALSGTSHQVVKQDYDGFGRMFRTTEYATAVESLPNFDRTTVASAVVTTANDRIVQYVYDTAGQQRFVLQADQNGRWTVGENRYNPFGNLVESRRYDRFASDTLIAPVTMRPTSAGEQDVIELLSALGYNDEAPATLVNIQRSRFAYDTQNRLRFTVDALGTVDENVYDTLGDLKTTVRFATRPTLSQYTERAIDAAVDRNDAGNRVQHFAYDNLGQLRFNVKVFEPNVGTGGKHAITERRYDALGQLVQNRGYYYTLGHLAAYDEQTLAAAIQTYPAYDRILIVAYDAGGRQALAVRQVRVGPAERYIVTKQIHDALGRLMQRIDYAKPVALTQFDLVSIENAVVLEYPNDRTTTFVYDAAERLRFEIRPDQSFRENLYDALDRVTESRLFNFRLSNNVQRTEAEMIALRGNHAVGDRGTRGQVQTWDAGGRLITSVDALGNTERYEYDVFGDRIGWVDKNGNDWMCRYDRTGRKTSEFSARHHFKIHGEDLATPSPGRIIETRFEYDAFGNNIRKIEAANFTNEPLTTDFAFDTMGRPISTLYHGYYDTVRGTVQREPGPNRFRREASITYDAMGNAVRFSVRTDLNSFRHTYRTYNSQGQVVHEINARNNVTGYTYVALGEVLTITRYSVSISGTPQNSVFWTAAEIDPQLILGHDEGGHPIPDVYARPIRLFHDKVGRKSAVVFPRTTFYSTKMPGEPTHANDLRPNPAWVVGVEDAAATAYEYNAFGDLVLQRVRANNIVEFQETRFTYDGMGRPIRSVDPAGNVTTRYYDPAGNVVGEDELTGEGQQNGTDRITQFYYNALDQLVQVDRYGLRYTDAEGVEHGAAYWTWDDGGHWVDSDADVATTVRTATYDAYGRPLSVTDAAGNVTSMRYDELGHLIEVVAPARMIAPVDANGEVPVDPFRNQLSEKLVTTMTIDTFGRVVRQVQATSQGGDARETRQTFDLAGNLISNADERGNIKRRSFDIAGRVIKETQDISVELGPLGHNSQGLERRYFYDVLGQLTDTLDVYVDGDNLVQSGKSVVYNAFGEVVVENRKWGAASQPPSALNTAKVARYDRNNAGQVFNKVAADGLSVYYYNMLGQMTREEKRGNSADSDGTSTRVTEWQYDVLGRVTMIRRPAFDVDVTFGTGTDIRFVTPYSSRDLDRWGNVTIIREGGFWMVNGQPTEVPNKRYRSYGYDDNNRLIRESLSTQSFVQSNGTSNSAQIAKLIFRDLLGNVVKEVDEARDPQSDVLLNSRTRRKQYDSVGHLTADIDATNRKVEYAYNIHGQRMGSRNARGTVFFERRDRRGNVIYHGVLRTSATPPGEYDSFAGTGTIIRTLLATHIYDQASRRFATKTLTDGGDAPWSYTWLDGRNFGVKQSDAMGMITQYRFDPFGNKSLQIDGAGIRSEWTAATTDYAVGRLENYRLPTDTATTFGDYYYNDFGELSRHEFGDAITQYDRHQNGLVYQITIIPNGTEPTVKEFTRYQYDAYGKVTMEGRIDSDTFQTKMISYDNQGRLSKVELVQPSGPTCDVDYSYDEWGNVRSVKASYTLDGNDGPWNMHNWYDYDSAGRMTISNGSLVNHEIRLKQRTSGSVSIRYDHVGRREFTTEYIRANTNGTPTLRTWDTMRYERYAYNDLGHLRQIEQRIGHINILDSGPGGSHDPEPRPNRFGDWKIMSTRKTNLRGAVIEAGQWTRISAPYNTMQVDEEPTFLGTTFTNYRADGQAAWTKTEAADPVKTTLTTNTYNSLTGLLDSYVFNAFRSDGVPFNTTFQYRYTFQNGSRVVKHILDTSNSLDTSKKYDLLGRLIFEEVELAKPNGPGSDRFEERRYEYGPDGRAIFKKTELRLSAVGSNTVPLPDPPNGRQTYVYAGNRIVGTIGSERLLSSTKFEFVYTPMSEAPAGGNVRYVVQNGDSLIDIAQMSYGDGALWYAIADANGITAEPSDPLPSSEVGKAYAVPDVVRSRYSDSTFTPFPLAEIVGNDRPISIPAPPPDRPSDLEMLAVGVASIGIQVGVTFGLSMIGVPAPLSFAIGAGLSNLGSQATAMALDMPGQDGIDWGGVGKSAFQGYFVSVGGPLGVLGWEIGEQVSTSFAGWTDESGVSARGIAGSVFNVGFSALAPVLDGPTYSHFNFNLSGLINGAYNPRSGWAVPGSGRSPVVGSLEHFFGVVANGLANMAYDAMAKQAEQPSTPAEPGSVALKEQLPPGELGHQEELASDRISAEEQSSAEVGLQGKLELSHFRDGVGRDLIAAARRVNDAERRQIEAENRLRAASRSSKQRLKALEKDVAARTEALARYYEYLENEAQIQSSMNAEGYQVHVSHGLEFDGLFIKQGGQMVETGGVNSGLHMLSPELREVLQENYKALSDAPYVTPQEFVNISAQMTPATIARIAAGRGGGPGYIATFSQFSERYERKHGSTEGVEQAFLEYHFQRSKDIAAQWKRTDNANLAVNLIGGGTALIGYSFVDPMGAAGFVLSMGVEKGLTAVGVAPEYASLAGGLTDIVTGYAGAFLDLQKAFAPSMQKLLHEQRVLRAQLDASHLTKLAAEYELSKGIQVAEGVTLFKNVTAEARAARSGAHVAPLIDVPSSAPMAIVKAGDLPVSGGVPAVAGLHFYAPGPVHSLAPLAASAAHGLPDALRIGGSEPVSRLIANISNDGGGFVGGAISGVVHNAAPNGSFSGITRDITNMRAHLSPQFLKDAIEKSGVTNFVFKSIAQNPEQLAHWNQAISNVSKRTNAFTKTVGLELTGQQSRAAFQVVNTEFRKLSGLQGTAVSTHHFYPNALHPELALDPRNLFVVGDAIVNGQRVGEHIFLHMLAQPSTWSGPLRTGMTERLRWAKPILEALE